MGSNFAIEVDVRLEGAIGFAKKKKKKGFSFVSFVFFFPFSFFFFDISTTS